MTASFTRAGPAQDPASPRMATASGNTALLTQSGDRNRGIDRNILSPLDAGIVYQGVRGDRDGKHRDRHASRRLRPGVGLTGRLRRQRDR